jgi:beta-lactamase class C
MLQKILSWALASVATCVLVTGPSDSAEDIRAVVDASVKPVMAEYGIPGMSVGILVNGKKHVFHYGVTSRQTKEPVTDQTIFEIGSLSKPFTGTLGAVLQAEGLVNLSASAESVMGEFAGSSIGSASLLQLATYTAGGLPLQFPDGVDAANFVEWYREVKPGAALGSSRLYSNPSIGLFGHLSAKAAGGSFEQLLHEKVLKPLALSSTFLTVPSERTPDYAQGYTRDDKPVRVNPGLFDDEAYGVKITASDFLRFVEASVSTGTGNPQLDQGLRAARSGFYSVRAMHQGLGWELYPAPARRADLLQGADPKFVLEPNVVEAVDASVVDPSLVGTVSKTGSTAGFGAYALFSPERKVAIVMLANRFWSNPARITVAHAILSELDPDFAAD